MITAHFIFPVPSHFFSVPIKGPVTAEIKYEWNPARKQAIVLSIGLNPAMFELVGNRGLLVQEIEQAAENNAASRFLENRRNVLATDLEPFR